MPDGAGCTSEIRRAAVRGRRIETLYRDIWSDVWEIKDRGSRTGREESGR